MRLALSSGAAPDLDLAALLATCARRGVDAVELVSAHAHGVGPGMSEEEISRVGRELVSRGVRLTALHLADDDLWDAREAARLSAGLGTPIVARGIGAGAAVAIATLGGRILLAHGTDPDEARAAAEMAESLGSASAGTAWEVRPGDDAPDAIASVLDALPGGPAYVRLHGGGPEAAEQGGRGVGALLSRLALLRFAGPLVITPSTPRYHYVWRAWLGRAGGWGCGSKVGSDSIHSLGPA